MSMITGCPACGTLFRVVPDQLKISDGWVRCGHCSEVFDATTHLQAGSDDDLLPARDTQPDVLQEAALASEPGDPVAPAETRRVLEEPGAADPGPPPPAPMVAAAPPVPGDDEDDEASSAFHASLPAPDATRPAGLEHEPAYAVQVDSVLSEARASRPFVEDDDEDPPRLDDPELDGVGFVEQARRQLFWKRPLVRVGLLLLALGLAALLAAQVAVHDRDRLAAQHPDWKPWLERLCEAAHCRLGPPHRIDAIVIDNSGFSRVRQDTYRLSVTLKNQSAQPVAVPAVELTLTDGQDQPVVRRVLTVRELGAPADTLAPASDWSTSLTLAVAPPAGGNRIAGYRLLAFYP